MLIDKLQKQLKRKGMRSLPDVPGANWFTPEGQKKLEQWEDAVMQEPLKKFSVEVDIDWGADGEDNINASFKAMAEADLIHLPFPLCSIEIPGFTKWLFKELHHAYLDYVAIAFEEPGSDSILIWPAVGQNVRGEKYWGPVPVVFEYVKSTKKARWSSWDNVNEKAWKAEDHDRAKNMVDIADVMFRYFIVLLHTKGVRAQPVKHLGKTKLRNRDKPEYSHHVLRVYEYEKADDKSGATTPVTERKRVRMHLRRGHIRNQPYGRRLSKVKQVYIEPCIVGYEEEGTVTSEYEVVD